MSLQMYKLMLKVKSLFAFTTVFARSSVYENKVLSRNLSKLSQTEVPCFHKLNNTVSKMNGF